MIDKLSLDDFFDMLGRYGSDVSNWPLNGEQLDTVMTFLARSTMAREAIEEMRAMELQLWRDPPRAPAGLADRVLAAAGVIPAAAILARPRPRRRVLN